MDSITASTTASNILSDTFHFKTKVPTQKDLLPAYQKEVPVEQPKAKDISKYIESIPVAFKAVFQRIVNKYGNDEPNNTNNESEVWDTDNE